MAMERLKVSTGDDGGDIVLEVTDRFLSYLDYIAEHIVAVQADVFHQYRLELCEEMVCYNEHVMCAEQMLEHLHDAAHDLAGQQFVFRGGESPTDNLRHPGHWGNE